MDREDVAYAVAVQAIDFGVNRLRVDLLLIVEVAEIVNLDAENNGDVSPLDNAVEISGGHRQFHHIGVMIDECGNLADLQVCRTRIVGDSAYRPSRMPDQHRFAKDSTIVGEGD